MSHKLSSLHIEWSLISREGRELENNTKDVILSF